MQDINGVLDRRLGIQIRSKNEIGNVAVDADIAGVKTQDEGGGNPGIRAAFY